MYRSTMWFQQLLSSSLFLALAFKYLSWCHTVAQQGSYCVQVLLCLLDLAGRKTKAHNTGRALVALKNSSPHQAWLHSLLLLCLGWVGTNQKAPALSDICSADFIFRHVLFVLHLVYFSFPQQWGHLPYLGDCFKWAQSFLLPTMPEESGQDSSTPKKEVPILSFSHKSFCIFCRFTVERLAGRTESQMKTFVLG